MEDLIALAKSQLGRIKALCAQIGLKYVELPDDVSVQGSRSASARQATSSFRLWAGGARAN